MLGLGLGIGIWQNTAALSGGGGGGTATTWNPADIGPRFSLDGTKLVATHDATAAFNLGRATSGHSGTGDWSFTVTVTSSSDLQIDLGLANTTDATTTQLGNGANGVSFRVNAGDLYKSNAVVKALGLTFSVGDTLTVRLKNGNLYVAKNGTYAGSDPVAQTGGYDVSTMGTLLPAIGAHGDTVLTADFTNWP